MEYGRWILVAVRCTQIWNARGGLAGALQSRLIVSGCGEAAGSAGLIAGKPAPTGSAAMRITRRGFPKEASAWPYWQASQSGSSIAQAFGTGAGPAAWTGALSPPLETALSLPVLMVDFSVLVAARARR